MNTSLTQRQPFPRIICGSCSETITVDCNRQWSHEAFLFHFNVSFASLDTSVESYEYCGESWVKWMESPGACTKKRESWIPDDLGKPSVYSNLTSNFKSQARIMIQAVEYIPCMFEVLSLIPKTLWPILPGMVHPSPQYWNNNKTEQVGLEK